MNTHEKSVIIEFVGLPGTGKTTSSHYFYNVLKERGLQVCLIEDIERYLKSLNVYQRLYLLSKACVLRGHLLFLYFLVFASSRMFKLEYFIHYASLILRETALKHLIKEKRIDIVLLDQWAIQALWSSTIFYLKPTAFIIKYFKYLYLKTDFVTYFDIDPAIASKRMEMRPTFKSRFDLMDIERRKQELMKYNNYLIQLYLNSDCKNKHFFSTELSPSENAKAFLDILSIDKDTETVAGEIYTTPNPLYNAQQM